jgi:hypothetical protein
MGLTILIHTMRTLLNVTKILAVVGLRGSLKETLPGLSRIVFKALTCYGQPKGARGLPHSGIYHLPWPCVRKKTYLIASLNHHNFLIL